MEKILLSGIAGNLGKQVAKFLSLNYHVVGLDQRDMDEDEFSSPSVEFHRLDIRRNAVEALLRKKDIKAIVHLNVLYNPHKKTQKEEDFNIHATTRLLEHCVKYNIPKFVFLSSANIYGPRADTFDYLKEDAPLMASRSYVGIQDLIALDLLVQSFFFKKKDFNIVVLRPVNIVGPNIKNIPNTYFRRKSLVSILGFDPLIQLIHSRDVLMAILLSIQNNNARGVYNLAGPGVVPLSVFAKKLNRKVIRVPEKLLKMFARLTLKANISNFPEEEIIHLKYSSLVDDSRIKEELGYKANVSYNDIMRNLNSIG